MELVESRRSFHCRHCGRYHSPQSVDADGIRVLGHRTNAPRCPVCAAAMADALLHDEPIDFCETCRGMLLSRGTFAELVHRQRRWAQTPPSIPSPLDRTSLDRHLKCPKCGKAFDTYPYGGPGNTVIDGCDPCNAVWLDYGEFRQIVDAPGRDRGRL